MGFGRSNSDEPKAPSRLAGSLQLTGHLAFPALLVAMLTRAPVMVQASCGDGISGIYFALLSFGFAGFFGFALAHIVAQRRLHVDWPVAYGCYRHSS